MELRYSLVPKGIPIEADLNDVSPSTWNKVSGMIAEFNLDTGENYLTLHLAAARQLKIPTTSLEIGSYTLVLNLTGTSLCFVQSVLIGVPDMEDRMDRFSQALTLRTRAVNAPPRKKAELLREVETNYRSLELDDLADTVKEEIAELTSG